MSTRQSRVQRQRPYAAEVQAWHALLPAHRDIIRKLRRDEYTGIRSKAIAELVKLELVEIVERIPRLTALGRDFSESLRAAGIFNARPQKVKSS
jgi:hypothetical protein